MVGGVIFAADLTTCNDNTYDYFVVRRSIAHAVVGVQRLEDGGMSPRWASRLLLRGDARRFAIRKLIRPPKVGGLLPHGPSEAPPDYSSVRALAGEERTVNEAMITWYEAARKEFSSIAGMRLNFAEARF